MEIPKTVPDDDQLRMLMQAISVAARAHAGQYRKDGATPYVAHPLRVMAVLRHVFGIDDLRVLMAGVLHDTIEDTTVDRDDLIAWFGADVASYVAALSKDMRLAEEERERQYLQALVEAPVEVKLCKLADAYDNLADSSCRTEKARQRLIERTKQLLDRFDASLSGQWAHALESVRRQIHAAEAGT